MARGRSYSGSKKNDAKYLGGGLIIVAGAGLAYMLLSSRGRPIGAPNVSVDAANYYVGGTITWTSNGLILPIQITVYNTSTIGVVTPIAIGGPWNTAGGSFVVGNNLIGTNYLTATDANGVTVQSGTFTVPIVRPF